MVEFCKRNLDIKTWISQVLVHNASKDCSQPNQVTGNTNVQDFILHFLL